MHYMYLYLIFTHNLTYYAMSKYWKGYDIYPKSLLTIFIIINNQLLVC